MSKILKGKKGWTKIVAFVMAIVMVLSVIYVGNRNSKVDAAEPVSMGEIGVDGYMLLDAEASLLNGEPYMGAKTETYDVGYEYGYYDVWQPMGSGEVKVKVVSSSVDATIEAVEAATPVTKAEPGDTIVYYVYTDTIISKVETFKLTTNYFSSYTPALTFNPETEKVAVTGSSGRYLSAVKYYIDHEAEVADASAIAWTDAGAAVSESRIEAVGMEYDGTYYLHAALFDREGNPVVIRNSAAAVRDFTPIMLSDLKCDGEDVGAEAATTTALGIPKKYTAIVDGKKCTEEVVITVNLSEDADSVTCTEGPGNVSVDEKAVTVTIAPDTALNNTNQVVSVEVNKANNPTVILQTTVKYIDMSPIVKDVTIDGESVVDQTIYTNESDYTINVDVDSSYGQPVLYVNGLVAEVTKEDPIFTLYKFGYVPTLALGANEYEFTAKMGGIDGQNSKKVNIFFDDVDPKLEAPVVNAQTTDGKYVDFNSTDAILTSYLPYSVSVDASDMKDGTTLSGISKVTYTKYVEDTPIATDIELSTADTGDVLTYTVQEAADTQYAGKTVKYVFTAYDRAGNSTTSDEVVVSFYKDEISISNPVINDEKAASSEDGITNSSSLSIDFTINSTDGIGKVILTKNGVETDVTADVVASGDVYKYTATINTTKSTVYEIALDATNANGVEAVQQTVKTIRVDLSKPVIALKAFEVGGNIFSGTEYVSKWYSNLILIFTVGNNEDGGDFASDLEYVRVSQNNADPVDVTLDESGEVKVIVEQSPTTSGTPVVVTAKDVSGNEALKHSETYYVDGTDPDATLLILDANGAILENEAYTGNGTYPTIGVQVEDTDLIMKSAKCEITYSAGGTDTTTTVFEITEEDNKSVEGISKTLDELISSPADGKYTVKVIVENLAGVTDEAEQTFYLDNSKPVIKVESYTSNLGSGDDAPSAGKWYKDLTLNMLVQDAGSRVAKIEVLNGTQTTPYEGTDLPSDGKFAIDVEGSADITGTEIKVTASDNIDNLGELTLKYCVDKEKPDGGLAIDDKASEDFENGSVIKGDPEIGIEILDNIQIASYELKIEATSLSEPKICGAAEYDSESVDITKKLSELLGVSELVDDEYTLTLTAKDLAGNEMEPVTVKFTVDNTAPVVTTIELNGESVNLADVSLHEADKEFFKALTLKVNASDGTYSSGIGTITITQYTVTEDGEETEASTITYNGVAETVDVVESISEKGTKVFVEVADKNDNKTPYTWYFFTDKTDPVPEITVADEAYSKSKDSFLKGDPDIVASDSDNIKIVSRKMTIVLPDGTTKEITDASYIGTNKLSKLIGADPVDGEYKITIEAIDKSNNKGVDSVEFTLDNTAPINDMKITTSKPKKFDKFHYTAYDGTVYGIYYDGSVVFHVECADVNVDIVTVEDNGRTVSISTTDGVNEEGVNVKRADFTVSAEGEHELVVKSVDKAGNIGAERALKCVVDKTVPVITTSLNGSSYTEGSGIRYLNTNANVGVNVTEVNKDADDNKRVVKMTRPSQATVTTTDKFTEGTNTFDIEADYEVTYSAIDCAGNESATKTLQFRVDKTAPALKITGIADGATAKSNVTVTYSMVEAFYWDMVKAEVTIYRKIDGESEKLLKTVQYNAKNANSSMSETFTEDGIYRFDFVAEDKCGNTANTKYTFILDGTAPIVAITGVDNFDMTTDPVTIGITITENFFTTNVVKIEGTRTDETGKVSKLDMILPNVNNAKITNITKEFTEDGIYDISIISTDKAGNSTSQKVHFTIDSTAPVLTDLSGSIKPVMNDFSWDYDYDELVSDLTVCDISVYVDGVLYDGISDIDDGKHIVRIEAVDELGNKSDATYEFLLDTVKPNIIITGIEEGQKILEPVEISVSVQIDADTLDTVLLNGTAQQLKLNSSTFTVDSVGKYTILAKAHDEAGNETTVELNFEFGKKFNPLWVIIPACIVLLLMIILLILKKRKKEDSGKRLS